MDSQTHMVRDDDDDDKDDDKGDLIWLSPSLFQFKVEIEPVEGVEVPYELPLWIIISAAVAGIFLLGIIILILWKVRLPISAVQITLGTSEVLEQVAVSHTAYLRLYASGHHT